VNSEVGIGFEMGNEYVDRLLVVLSKRRLGVVVIVGVISMFIAFLVGVFSSHSSVQSRQKSESFAYLTNIDGDSQRLRDLALRIRAFGRQMGVQSWVDSKASTQFAIISAYNQDKYDIMAELSSDTKAKYAAWHGYAYFIEKHNGPLFMIDALFRHWHEFDWLVWTDVDVLVTNAGQLLEDIVSQADSSQHVILSRDWGDVQLAPSVTFIRTSEEGHAFLQRWASEIEQQESKNEMLALRDGMQAKQAPEMQYVKYVSQQLINPYVNLVLKHEDGYNQSSPEHNTAHAFWKEGNLFVHIVDCISKCPEVLDAACCNGIAALYHSVFKKSLKSLIEEQREHSAPHQQQQQAPVSLDNWRLPFSVELCQA